MRTIFSFFIFSLVLISCKKENLCDCLKGTGEIVKEKRTIADFNSLEVHKNIYVTITQDSVNSIEVEAGENLLSLIETEVREGQLYITNNNTCNWVRSYEKEIHVYVHVKNLANINSYSSKDINSTNTITSPVLYIHNYFNGNIFLDIATDESYTKQMGAGGDITITGQSDYNYVFDQGYGFVYLQNLQSNRALIWQKGTGDIHLNVRDKLDVRIDHFGNVYYSGNPEIILQPSEGSGRLIHE
jgi:hypothetical protein